MNPDKIIDDFLSKKVIATSDDFTKNLFEKIEAENINDKFIDEFLSKEKIAPSANFTQKVMDKISKAKGFRIWQYGSSIVATVACITLALFITKTDKTSQLATEFQEIENTMASLSEYEKEFNSYAPSFCDYDLTLYAMQ